MPDNCAETILSESTAEFMIPANIVTEGFLNAFGNLCLQQINSRYYTLYVPLDTLDYDEILAYPYRVTPRLYTEMATTALEVSGITALANQPVLNLKGQGVIIGIIDGGIDYTHPAFLDNVGKSRILRIWDQTGRGKMPPQNVNYGTEYTMEQLNEALKAENPYEVVDTRDTTGHGTFLAGVAAGSEDLLNQFCGAAPLATLVVVKLKPAKEYLRRYYFINQDAIAYQENDIIKGINYIRNVAMQANLPLCIAFGLGGSYGSRKGFGALAEELNSFSYLTGSCAVVPSGNDGNTRKHFHGIVTDMNIPVAMEFTVENDVAGLTLEIWGSNPGIFSVSIESPSGEIIPRIPARFGEREEIQFLFDKTKLFIRYELAEALAGDELIFMRFEAPTAGLWRIQVYANLDNAVFDAYLPSYGLIGNKVYFLKADPNITLSDPSAAFDVITVSGYNPLSDAFFAESGRGFTRNNYYKPDLSAPAVNITGPNLRGGYENRSGTSAAAALTAGACAQFLTWAVTNQNYPDITAGVIKSALIRGAIRNPSLTYPSRQWGYGKLNVYNAFSQLRNQ